MDYWNYFGYLPHSYNRFFTWNGRNADEINDLLHAISGNEVRYSAEVVYVNGLVPFLRFSEEVAAPSGGFWEPTYLDALIQSSIARISNYEYNKYIAGKFPWATQPTAPLTLEYGSGGGPFLAPRSTVVIIPQEDGTMKLTWPPDENVIDIPPN